MAKHLSASWSSSGLVFTLMIGPIVAEVCPNADKSGWLWEIRVYRARRSTAVIARSFSSVTTPEAAQLEAQEALRNLSASIERVVSN